MKQNRTDLGRVVGANLKRLIKESEYRTQARFAEAYFVDERTVRRWVSQGVEKVYIIDELADFFKVDRMSLLSEREEVSPFYRTFGVLTLFQNLPQVVLPYSSPNVTRFLFYLVLSTFLAYILPNKFISFLWQTQQQKMFNR